jgi:hypothetical protein
MGNGQGVLVARQSLGDATPGHQHRRRAHRGHGRRAAEREIGPAHSCPERWPLADADGTYSPAATDATWAAVRPLLGLLTPTDRQSVCVESGDFLRISRLKRNSGSAVRDTPSALHSVAAFAAGLGLDFAGTKANAVIDRDGAPCSLVEFHRSRAASPRYRGM